jgi:hypothetical protein
MREIRMSGSMRGGRKRTFARRACLLLYGAPSENQNLPYRPRTRTGAGTLGAHLRHLAGAAAPGVARARDQPVGESQ